MSHFPLPFISPACRAVGGTVPASGHRCELRAGTRAATSRRMNADHGRRPVDFIDEALSVDRPPEKLRAIGGGGLDFHRAIPLPR